MKSVPKYHLTYNIVANVCFLVTNYGLFMDVVVKRDDLGHMMSTLRVLFLFILVSWMHMNLSLRKSAFERLLRLTESFTWDELPKRDPETGYITMAGLIPRTQLQLKWLTGILAVDHAIQCSYRIITMHDMVFNSWYPFSFNESPMYEVVIFVQFVGSWVAMNDFLAFLSFYAAMMSVACSQLEKAKANLRKIKEIKSFAKKTVVDGENDQEFEVHGNISQKDCHRMQKELNSFVRHHQSVLQFMSELENAFNLPLCGVFLILLAALCSAVFSAVVNWGNIADMAQAITAYVILMGTAHVTCSFGNDLTVQAEDIKHAAYSCNWVGTPLTFQSCIKFIITNASQEFTLTAGKFVPVSNETMMHMLQQSLSFFMFLLEMKNRNAVEK